MGCAFTTDDVLGSFVRCVKEVILQPATFFEQLPRPTGYAPAIVFASITLVVPVLIHALRNLGLTLLVAPLIWPLAIGSLWLWAAYLSWAVRRFAGIELDTVSALHLSAYANVPVLFGAMPVIGTLSGLWSLALACVALIHYAKVPTRSAVLIVAAPNVVLLVLGALAIGLLLHAAPLLPLGGLG